MSEGGLIGMEARTVDGVAVGRISDLLTDEDSGEVTHAVVERDDERFEVPISSITLDPEADFATFQPEPSDEEPGDLAGEEVEPEGYAPGESDADDLRHEGQLVTDPESEEEAQSEADLAREDWEDESHTPVDSGYPRTDAYIDPDTGEAEIDPAINEDEGLGDEVARLLEETDLEVRSVKEGVVEVTGAAVTQEDLEDSIQELLTLEGVMEVDPSDVDIG